jgi:Protein of unknown function (DUF1565)
MLLKKNHGKFNKNKSRLDLKFLTLFSFILFSLISNTYAVNVYYVATTGNNTNSGTSASPFRTLQRGVDVAVGGDTIIVKDGIYGPEAANDSTMPVNINKAGTPSAWITLKAEHKWGAVLDCRLTAHSYINFQENSAYWRIQNFEIKNGYYGGIWANSGGAKNILISGNHIHHIGNRVDNAQIGIVGIYTDAGAQNFTIDGNIINDVGRTNTYTNSFDHGIYSHGNLNIINNVFYRSLNGWHIQTAVNFSGTIANNTFYGPNMYAGYVKGGQIMLWDPASGDIVIRNNIFYDTKGAAIVSYDFSQAKGMCSCDHNIVSGNGVVLGAPSSCSVNNNFLTTDPLFVDTSTYNFHLKPGSAAINNGASVLVVTRDFDGRPRGAGNKKFDIGAFEYAGKIN